MRPLKRIGRFILVLKRAFTALYNECCHLDFLSVCQTVLSISSLIWRVRRCQQYFLSLYIYDFSSYSRHRCQHVVVLDSVLRSSRRCRSLGDCHRRASYNALRGLLRPKCSHHLQNFKRGVRCRVLSPVSLFLVCNDVLFFFLAFNYVSFYFVVFSQ